MKLNKFLSVLLSLMLLMGMVTSNAAPAPIIEGLFDTDNTYSFTESFDVARTQIATAADTVTPYSQFVSIKVFETDALTNITVADGKLSTAHRDDEIGISTTHAIPGPAEYVIDTEKHKASYMLDLNMTHTTIKTTTSGLYIGMRTENQFNEVKNLTFEQLSADGIWFGIAQNNVGVGSPLATASKVKRWGMGSDFKNISHFRIYDNVKDNVISYYTVDNDGIETLFATVTVGTYNTQNDSTPLTYTVTAQGETTSETINVAGQVSKGGMYYPQLYMCNMVSDVAHFSVTSAATTATGLTSLTIDDEEKDLETFTYAMDLPSSGQLKVKAQAPYGVTYEILVQDSEAEEGFRKIAAASGDNIVDVSESGWLKVTYTNGTDSGEYVVSFAAAPIFDDTDTSFEVLPGEELKITLSDYFSDISEGELEFALTETCEYAEIANGELIIDTSAEAEFEVSVTATNTSTTKTSDGAFSVKIFAPAPVFNANELETDFTVELPGELSVSLGDYFTDENSELEFSLQGEALAEIVEGELVFDTSEEVELASVTVVAENTFGKTVSGIFTFEVKGVDYVTFTETFDTNKTNFITTGGYNYSPYVMMKTFDEANKGLVVVEDGSFAATQTTGLKNFSLNTRYSIDGTSPYTMNLKLSTNNSYASAGLYFCLRATGKNKQFTTSVTSNSAVLPTSGIWLAVAQGNQMSIGFPARQSALPFTTPVDFSEPSSIKIYDDTLNNVIYFYSIDETTGAETLFVKINVSYTDDSRTKLDYTFYNNGTESVCTLYAGGVIAQTGEFYPQLWAHDAKINIDTFSVTSKAVADAECGNITLTNALLDTNFDESTYNYELTPENENMIVGLEVQAVRGISYKAYTDTAENIHIAEGINNIDLSSSNFLYIEADNGVQINTYTFKVPNKPYFKPDAADTLYFVKNSDESVDLTELFADNSAGTLSFSSEDPRVLISGTQITPADKTAEAEFSAEVTATNETTGKSVTKTLEFVVYTPVQSANAKSITLMSGTRNVTPDINLSGGSFDIVLEPGETQLKVDAELDYFGNATAVMGGRGITLGETFEIGSGRVLTLSVTHDSFPGTEVVYTFNIKYKPDADKTALNEFLNSFSPSEGESGLIAKATHTLDLSTVFSNVDDIEMTGYMVTDSEGNAFGTVTGSVWTFSCNDLVTKELKFTAQNAHNLSIDVTESVSFLKEKVPPVFTSYTLTVSDIGKNDATFTWSEATDESGITGYTVYYYQSGKTKEKISVAADVRSTELTNLSSGKTYYVYVEATDLYGNININKVQTSFTTESSGGGGGGGGNSAIGGNGFAVSYETLNTPVPVVDENKVIFTDLEGYDWAKDAVYRLAETGIVNGVDVNTYEPGRSITRAEFTAILVRALGFTGTDSAGFADVTPDKWYYEAVTSAKACKVIMGDGENFRPEDTITRQDMMVMTCRALETAGKLSAKAPADFPDNKFASDYARESIGILVGSGIITGDDSGNVNPQGNANRAEIAVMIDRILNGK